MLVTQICPFVFSNSKKIWDWVLYQYHHMLSRWPLPPTQEQTFHHSDNCSVTVTVIKLPLCQALPKSTHFTALQVQQNSFLNNTKLLLELCVPGHQTSCRTGGRFWLLPAANLFTPGKNPTVGFNQRQSHQHLPLTVQTSEKWGEKRKRVGGYLCSSWM